MKIAVFPGSFEPITVGHCDILERALPLFDKIVVAIGQNSQKKYLFSLEQRLQFIAQTFSHEPKIEVTTYTGLTIHFCQQIGANYLLRGIRSSVDFEYERNISQMNFAVSSNQIETVFLICQPAYSHISSTIVREVLIGKGKVDDFLPPQVRHLISLDA